MELQMVLFRMLVLVIICSVNPFVRASNVINNSCQKDCGNVSISYPFGIGNGCYVEDWFEIVCRSSNNSYDLGFPKPFLKKLNYLEVLEIDIDKARVRVSYPIFSSCTNVTNSTKNLVLEKSPFDFSAGKNSFIAMGCNNSASMWNICNTTNCCQTTLSSYLKAFSTTIEPKLSSSPYNGSSECKYAFLVDQNWFETNFTWSNPNMFVPVVLDWSLDNTTFNSLPIRKNMTAREYKNSTYSCYRWLMLQNIPTIFCRCESGYRGNPYLVGGCEGKFLIRNNLFNPFNS
ncbi:hypothetical protein I3843_04G067400 [Carya illinoinensis]|nr:hypothetical protein I3843_04G067400 [Carya illinoinensis]